MLHGTIQLADMSVLGASVDVRSLGYVLGTYFSHVILACLAQASWRTVDGPIVLLLLTVGKRRDYRKGSHLATKT